MPYSDPDRQREYARNYRRIRRAGDPRSTPVHPVIPTPVRLATADAVRELLEEQIALVRAEAGAATLEKARAVGYLATVLLRTIEAGNLAARIEELEAVLNRRRKKQ